jgi:hypothetical protein
MADNGRSGISAQYERHTITKIPLIETGRLLRLEMRMYNLLRVSKLQNEAFLLENPVQERFGDA